MTDATLSQIARKMAEQIFDLQAAGRIMHESWTATKRAQHFHHPSEPCDLCTGEGAIHCPTHPDLVPWDDLPQKQKDINLNAFRDVFAVLAPKAESALCEFGLLALEQAEQITHDEEVESVGWSDDAYNHACKHIRDSIAKLKSELNL